MLAKRIADAVLRLFLSALRRFIRYMGYSFDSRVRYSEIGEDGKLKLSSLINYFQDCSTFHSEERGVGLEYFAKVRQSWLLNAWQIVIERMPAMGERIKIKTKPYKIKGIYGMRNFMLTDEDDNMLAYANSIWFMFDFANNRVIKADDVQKAAYPEEPRLEMDYAPRKINVPGEGFEKLKGFEVLRHHLDTNSHMNNGQYVVLAMDCLPPGVDIRQVRVEYRNAAVVGDQIIPRLYHSGDTWIVSLDDENDSTYAVVEFKDR